MLFSSPQLFHFTRLLDKESWCFYKSPYSIKALPYKHILMSQPNDGHFTINFLIPKGINPVLGIICKLLNNFTAAVSRTKITAFNITINCIEAGKKQRSLCKHTKVRHLLGDDTVKELPVYHRVNVLLDTVWYMWAFTEKLRGERYEVSALETGMQLYQGFFFHE